MAVTQQSNDVSEASVAIGFALAAGAFAAVLVFAHEMNPGRVWLNLAWAEPVYYALVAVLAAASGAAMSPYRLAGMCGGAISGAGVLWTLSMLLAAGTRIPFIAIWIVAALGAVPGLIIYFLCYWVLRSNDDKVQDQAKGADPNGPSNDAFQALNETARAGDPRAQYELGKAYLEGTVPGGKKGKAVSWLRKAADSGHVDAMFLLGTLYQQGNFIARNLDDARKLFDKAAKAGHAEAQVRLAQLEQAQS